MKTGFQIAKLVYKAKQGKLTEEEQAVLEEWMAEGEGRRWLVERICGEEYWEGQWAEHHAYDVERGWRRFRREVRALEARRRLVRWGSVAAGIAVVAGAVLFVAERKGEAPAVMPVVEAVEPGRSVAVLTLADGSRMVLGDTLRASLQESGTEIRIEGDRLGYAGADSVASGRQNKVSTPRGGEFRITLGDGTQVWLNAESELSYPVVFAGGRREVELRGEAYFEVARDAARPFIVKTAAMDVRVLGTSFNVCPDGRSGCWCQASSCRGIWTGRSPYGRWIRRHTGLGGTVGLCSRTICWGQCWASWSVGMTWSFSFSILRWKSCVLRATCPSMRTWRRCSGNWNRRPISILNARAERWSCRKKGKKREDACTVSP